MGAIQPYFSHLVFRTSTFHAYFDLHLKSKYVSLFSYTLKVSSDHNPISHGVIEPYFSRQAIWMSFFKPIMT